MFIHYQICLMSYYPTKRKGVLSSNKILKETGMPNAYMTMCRLYAYMPMCLYAFMTICLYAYMPLCLYAYMPNAYMPMCLCAYMPNA